MQNRLYELRKFLGSVRRGEGSHRDKQQGGNEQCAHDATLQLAASPAQPDAKALTYSAKGLQALQEAAETPPG